MKKLVYILLFLLSNNITLASEEMLPSSLLMTDSYFTHHVLVAEKSTHKLYLYENDNTVPKLVKVYQMATGKKAGNKLFQGDYRTPEGVYEFTQFLTHQDLINRHGKEGEIYGVGAFVMNYPNPMDVKSSKTGSGIWLHSTNDETRIEKGLDSRGCIVAANKNLIDIARYIELNKTIIVVVHELKFLTKDTWMQKRQKLAQTIQHWRDSWLKEELDQYMTHYHSTQFFDRYRGDYNSFRTYKRNVFSTPGNPTINLDSISILLADSYAVVTFKQDYTSNTVSDTGKKTLYLKRDEFYNWKIVSENWTKAGIDTQISEEQNNASELAFRPSMRFFKSTNIEDYLEVKGAN